MVHRTTMALLAVALVLSACGGGGEATAGVASLSEDDVTATTAAAAGDEASDPEDVEAAMLEWAECMRAEGVDVQDPTVDADGNVQLFAAGGGEGGPGGDPGDREAMEAAFEACNDLMEGVSLGFERGDQTEMQDTLLEFAACMRDNGIDMPDPDISSFGPPDEVDGEEGEPGQGGPFGGVDMDDPDFQAAQEACSDILGGFGPGGGGPGGGPGATNTQESDSDA